MNYNIDVFGTFLRGIGFNKSCLIVTTLVDKFKRFNFSINQKNI